MPRRLRIALTVLALVATGCGRAGHSRTEPTHPEAPRSSTRVIPTESPRPGPGARASTRKHSTRSSHSDGRAAATGPTLTTPPTTTSATTATAAAGGWAIAANSSSYRDPTPGAWTARAQPYVIGAEAAAERTQRSGSGGSTWTQIVRGRCAMSLRDLTVAINHDAPASPIVKAVHVSATTTLSCATGTVQLSPFAAQLVLTRTGARWHVARVSH